MRSNGKREKWVEEFYLNCHVPCKEETAKNKGTQHTKKKGDQKQQEKAGILNKKKGTQEKLKRGRSYENLRKPELLTRGLQATHELGGLNVEV